MTWRCQTSRPSVAAIAITETVIPSPAAAVRSPPRYCCTARTARLSAEIEISTTWNIAASASALPWPKRWVSSSGRAAIHTAASVARLATRSSAVSARLPNIAVDPVDQAAQVLSPASSAATAMLASAALRLSAAAFPDNFMAGHPHG